MEIGEANRIKYFACTSNYKFVEKFKLLSPISTKMPAGPDETDNHAPGAATEHTAKHASPRPRLSLFQCSPRPSESSRRRGSEGVASRPEIRGFYWTRIHDSGHTLIPATTRPMSRLALPTGSSFCLLF